MKTSTNALTKRYAESQGWLCDTVQRFYGGKRHDLFGFVDSILLLDGVVYFIQNCSYGTLKAHREAIQEHPNFDAVQRHGCLELWEWRRKKAKRGGKRIAREWYVRAQTATGATWGDVGEWDGPLDLYSKKEKKCPPAS